MTEVLDNRRNPCAVGLIRAATRMAQMRAGESLAILSRDMFAPREIPLWAARDGFDVRSNTRRRLWPRRYHVFVIAR